MNILITGHQGYIGCHLTRILKSAGHSITGCDLRIFKACDWNVIPEADQTFQKDFRNLTAVELEGIDAICHLAGISNDPMGELDSNITKEVNETGTIEFASLAKRAGVKRFLFSSSCSIYGTANTEDISENGTLNPITAYAESKINAEKGISNLADDDFSPVYLRNATAYGYSPCFRIDLVVNNLIASGHLLNHINVLSDGTPWRPYIHCEDIARAFAAILHAQAESTHNMALNIGENEENFQVKTIADFVKQELPEAQKTIGLTSHPDPRDYRVNFDLLNKTLPRFGLLHNVRQHVPILLKHIQIGMTDQDWDDKRFIRLHQLKSNLHLLK